MKRLAEQTLYEILEVPPDAAAEQIQAAYERASALYAPGSIVTYTLMDSEEAALLTSRIEDARGTLLDPERRARYDVSLHERPAEVRAAVSATAGAAPAPPLPPVIPAVQAGAAGERDAGPAAPLPEAARPAILLDAALDAAGPAAEGAGEARKQPILLHREISPTESAPPAAAPPEALPPPIPAALATAAPPPLPDTWTGEALRQVREGRGISVQQIAERTKVTRHHIENIESDRFAALPAQVYLRGILLTIARELRLDGQKVARSYLERLAPPPAAAPKPR